MARSTRLQLNLRCRIPSIIETGILYSLSFFKSFRLNEFEVYASSTVTIFTSHIDFTPGRLISIFFRIVIFLQVGGMTRGAHGVPVLTITGPMQPIFYLDVLSSILMKPLILSRIPTGPRSLHSSTGKRNQVLL